MTPEEKKNMTPEEKKIYDEKKKNLNITLIFETN
jgi:hypothetical protein